MSSCCGPGTEPGGTSRGAFRLRSIIFIVVIAAAIAVAAWSLVKANRSEADIRADGQSEETSILEDARRLDLGAPYGLADLAPDKDFAFVLLAGADAQEMTTAAQAIKQTTGTLAGRGIEAAALTIETDDPRYEDMADVFEVAAFPAVVLLGGGCGARVVSGDITEDELLKGYVQAACATGCGPSGCGPNAAKSGCCPGQ
ncbi:MAG: hypothetical protein ABIJ00_05600 [Candidatus Eisenbacteria bacterium]